MTETALNKFVNSRYGLFAFAIVALIVSYANSFGSETVADAGGLLPYSIGSISLSPFASWLANSLCICLSGVLLYIINKSFAFIRNYTVVHVTVFLFFLSSTLRQPLRCVQHPFPPQSYLLAHSFCSAIFNGKNGATACFSSCSSFLPVPCSAIL